MASEWRRFKFSEVCSEIVDCVNKTAPIVDAPTPFRMIRVTNIRDGRLDLTVCNHVEEETFKKWTRRSLPRRGDVLLTREAPLGEVAIIKGETGVFLGQRIMQFRADPELLDPRFLYYSLLGRDLQGQIHSHSGTGSTVDHIRVPDCSNFTILMPNLREQEAIADLLWCIDERIDTLRGAAKSLEAIARAIFKSWFVDFDAVRAKAEGREPEGMDAATAALFPSEFQESATGLFPTGWASFALGNISTVGIGKTPPRAQSQWFSESDTDVVWVSIRDMGKSGSYIRTSSEFLTREAVERFNVRLVPDNTVILSFKLTVGRVAISDGTLTTNEAIAHCVLGQDAPVSTEFLYCALSAFDFSSLSSTSSIAEAVNSKSIRELKIAVPAKQEMDGFTVLVKPIFERIKHSQRTMANLTDLRDTVLPRLISGKLRVPEAEKLAEAVL